jgi:hypothetical protein
VTLDRWLCKFCPSYVILNTLGFWTIDRVHWPNDSECSVPVLHSLKCQELKTLWGQGRQKLADKITRRSPPKATLTENHNNFDWGQHNFLVKMNYGGRRIQKFGFPQRWRPERLGKGQDASAPGTSLLITRLDQTTNVFRLHYHGVGTALFYMQ